MNEAKAMEEMKRLKGTQTEKNLAAAFAGESQAHVKYTLFARQGNGRPGTGPCQNLVLAVRRFFQIHGRTPENGRGRGKRGMDLHVSGICQNRQRRRF